MTAERVVVVGAGIGGLTAAALLAAHGHAVTVIDKECAAGGKLRTLGHPPVDAGPTVFTMKWVFEALFEACGADVDRAMPAARADLLARHGWGDGSRLDLFADVERSAEAIGDLAGAREAAGFRAFAAEAKAIHDLLADSFMRGTATNPFGLVARIGLKRIGEAMAIRPHRSLWSALSRHFADPRLRQLFGRYATYNGSSPFSAPATLMLIAHVEQSGVWLVEGGMHSVATAIETLARRNGANFRFGETVTRIETDGGAVAAVRLANGERIATTRVVFNGDASAIGAGRLGNDVRHAVRPLPPVRRSLSAVVLTGQADIAGFPVVRHNVLFSPDYRAEFDDIFKRRRLPAHPTIYLCAQDRDDHGALYPGATSDRVQIIINAPANGDSPDFSDEEIATCRNRTPGFLAQCGLALSWREPPQTSCPRSFEQLFPCSGGALYGRATHGWRAAFQRPAATTRIPGLYLTGGTTHPGAGVPMAALSGFRAAEAVMASRASTPKFRPVAMPGGMQTG